MVGRGARLNRIHLAEPRLDVHTWNIGGKLRICRTVLRTLIRRLRHSSVYQVSRIAPKELSAVLPRDPSFDNSLSNSRSSR